MENFLENHILYFPYSAIQKFLKTQKASYATKDYEFFSALLICAFCKYQWNKDCKIGFPITLDFAREFSKKQNATIEEVVAIFRRGINQNSPVDFIVASDDGCSQISFQIKRFGIGRKKKNTQALVDFLNSSKLTRLPKRHDLVLVATLDSGVNFNGSEFVKNFDFENFKFGGLIIFGEGAKDKKLFFLQIIPTNKQGITFGINKLHSCDIGSLSLET